MITLRSFREEDLAILSSIRNDPDLQSKLFLTPIQLSNELVREWINRRANDPKGTFSVVALDDKAIGFAQLFNIERTSGEIGLCIAPQFQGNGFGSKALDLLHQHASSLQLKRLTLKVASSNHAAISLYRKAGYQPFGILMEASL